MRVRIGTCLAFVLVASAAGGASGNSYAQAQGRLSGVTQITYGCPGPQREGEPCEHWSSFPHARFRVTQLAGAETRTVTSDRQGRFTLLLALGRYRLTPLKQEHTTGGTPLTVSIRAGATTWARVRFQGFPRML